MERTISPEDRIRRAEEIYYRRKNISNVARTATLNFDSKKENKLLKKAFIQVILCVGIFFLINSIQANTDDLSIDSIKHIKNMLNYDMNFKKYINEGKSYLSNIYNKNKEENEEIKQQNDITDNKDNIADANDLSTVNDVEEETPKTNQEVKDENEIDSANNISKMEQDAKYIKDKISIIKPAQGEISSRFGPRNPTTDTVPKYHTGIDIAVTEGTKFVSAMDGTVELVSSEGDYRKSCKNNKWRCFNNICTL